MPENDTKGLNEKKTQRAWKEGLFIAVRLILGCVFLYASLDKILHPAAFAKAIYNYQILPDALINLTAIILPWLEVLLGIFLILGGWFPGAIFLTNFLLAVFFGALVFNLARGLDIYCGCFSTSQEAGSGESMVWYVIRDGIFLIMALYLFSQVFSRRQLGIDGRHI